MKSFHNIEKSAFRKGEYVGYSEGKVYRISKTNSSFGSWFAHNQDNWNDQIFAFGLDSMSKKLQEKAVTA
jgi:Tfp pilus assembly protein PilP